MSSSETDKRHCSLFGRNKTNLHGFPGGTRGKELTCQCRRCKRRGFNPWVGKIYWKRKWQPSPVFLPGESLGQRSLVGYSPRGCKESDTTERLSMYAHHGRWDVRGRGSQAPILAGEQVPFHPKLGIDASPSIPEWGFWKDGSLAWGCQAPGS